MFWETADIFGLEIDFEIFEQAADGRRVASTGASASFVAHLEVVAARLLLNDLPDLLQELDTALFDLHVELIDISIVLFFAKTSAFSLLQRLPIGSK